MLYICRHLTSFLCFTSFYVVVSIENDTSETQLHNTLNMKQTTQKFLKFVGCWGYFTCVTYFSYVICVVVGCLQAIQTKQHRWHKLHLTKQSTTYELNPPPTKKNPTHPLEFLLRVFKDWWGCVSMLGVCVICYVVVSCFVLSLCVLSFFVLGGVGCFL